MVTSHTPVESVAGYQQVGNFEGRQQNQTGCFYLLHFYYISQVSCIIISVSVFLVPLCYYQKYSFHYYHFLMSILYLSFAEPCVNMLQPHYKPTSYHLLMYTSKHIHTHTHGKTLHATAHSSTHCLLHRPTSCKLPPAFSKTSLWTEASASAAINHGEAGAEGKAHLVHVGPTPGLNKP